MGSQKPGNDKEADYSKSNEVHILKIRHLIRKNKYLEDPKISRDHTDIENSIAINEDMLKLQEIGSENLSKYMLNKENAKNDTVRLTMAYVTYKELEE